MAAMRRRRFLAHSIAAAAGCALDGPSLARVLAWQACDDGAPAGELLGTLPLTSDRPRPTPFGEPVGGPGLDTRQFTDLSRITPERLVTPTPEVYVRTAPPPAIAAQGPSSSIALGGPSATNLPIGELLTAAVPMGAHLIECAGNNNPDNFGLLSVAEWTGVPLEDVARRLGSRGGSYGVLVTGVDDEQQQASSSVAGASWVVPWTAIAEQRPFLSVGMNGEPLPLEHGAPVRLVVPGWYGCSWIKWVREIRLVDANAAATSQMLEFAGRTHQNGQPELARDYVPPLIDLAATPIRVEQRRVNGAIEYRIVGIVWGGARPVTELLIRFDARDAWKPLQVCPAPRSPATWSLWTYRWKPTEPGTYSISLKAADPSIRTRRLDMYFYTRRVRIDAV
jgi:DMSO/TMAO reductase YedYZ molybdopterin-dependent catalytic subunit